MVNLYVKTFFVSFIIFSLGIILGINIESFIVSDFAGQTNQVENSMQEMELEMLYFQSIKQNDSCSFLNEIVRRTNINLDKLSEELSQYSKEKMLFTRNDVDELKRRYTLLLIKNWLLQEKIKEQCGTNTISVLYFYDTKNCEDCLIQGKVLSLFKYSLKEKIMIFPIDINIDSSMVKILIEKYNITVRPSLEVDEIVYKGILTKDELKTILCSKLDENNKQTCYDI